MRYAFYMAQEASRRVGKIRFKFQDEPRISSYRTNRKKLTRSQVYDIRLWASREGFGMDYYEQARMLRQTDFSFVAEQTLYEVLCNRSWFDPNYKPKTPDLTYWKRISFTGFIVRNLERMNAAMAE